MSLILYKLDTRSLIIDPTGRSNNLCNWHVKTCGIYVPINLKLQHPSPVQSTRVWLSSMLSSLSNPAFKIEQPIFKRSNARGVSRRGYWSFELIDAYSISSTSYLVKFCRFHDVWNLGSTTNLWAISSLSISKHQGLHDQNRGKIQRCNDAYFLIDERTDLGKQKS